MFVVGVNPVFHVDQIPSDFPQRDRLIPDGYRQANGDWLDQGNTVIVGPKGNIIAGPVRMREETLIADLDMGEVLSARRQMDPVGHYNRPDVFQLYVDTSPRRAVIEHKAATAVSRQRPVGGDGVQPLGDREATIS
jgi:nitrilase